MAYSYARYTGDGVTTQFPINFTLGYISKDDVHVYVNNVVTSFTWVSDYIIELISAPSDGADVLIRRIVDKEDLIHDYIDGAVIVEKNLDDSNKQTLMAVHEMLDGFLNIVQAEVATLYETKILTSGQTQVQFDSVASSVSFYIVGDNVDNGRLLDVVDYSFDIATSTVTLTQSYPAGTILALIGVQYV